ncbi:ABC transporter substrate-binding protein [Halomonas sp. BL6]|uniref:ABC transporter substrate-binding protein n=1 Tax=Halomonas sp. BL6 TaxID=2585770 RepID=UPI00111BC8E6|nr:ABC transporter substrate-binding protein [Halomonas sp. BL6]TNH14117.1 ABC transporter substrate-binding protein [Halomonas sp. BL6]
MYFLKRLDSKRHVLFATAFALTVLMSSAQAQDDPLRVSWTDAGSFQPYFIAERQGWFEEAGLNVELVEGSNNPSQAIARLQSGEVDITSTGSTPTIAAIAQGLPIKIVFSNQSLPEQPTVGLVVRSDSPYHSIEDLEDRKIGALGMQSTGSLLVYRAFREAGMPYDSAEMVHMHTTSMIDSLKNENVDAIVPFAIFYDLAINSGDFRLISEPYDNMVGVPGIVNISSERVIAERSDEITKLVEVMDRAYQYANEHPEEVRSVDREMTRLPDDYLDARPIPPTDVRLDTNKLKQLAADLLEFGFINKAPTLDEMLWDGMPR